MCGWVHLPRFIDKIRLRKAGKLPADYHPNFCQGFDGAWLDAVGVECETFIRVVEDSITDGEVADWVLKNVEASADDKERFNQLVLNRGRDTDEYQEKLRMRKNEAGLEHRDDIQTMVDFIDADEGR